MYWFIRMARSMITMLIVAIMSSILTVGTTAIVVDRYIQKALIQFNIPIERKPLTLISIWDTLFGSDKKIEGDAKFASDSNVIESMDAKIVNNSYNQSKVKSEQVKRENGEDNREKAFKVPSNGVLPVMGGLSSQRSKVHDNIVVSPDAISKSKEQLSKGKKEQIFTTLIKKLPQEEWQRLSTLMEGGLTSGEVLEVEQILAKHLNDKEYKEMRKWMVIE